MLKPEQISNAQFTLVGKGAYRAEEVDAFLKSAAESVRRRRMRKPPPLPPLKRRAPE